MPFSTSFPHLSLPLTSLQSTFLPFTFSSSCCYRFNFIRRTKLRNSLSSTASGRKKSGNVEIKSQKHSCSFGSSTLNPPIETSETRSPFPDFFYRALFIPQIGEQIAQFLNLTSVQHFEASARPCRTPVPCINLLLLRPSSQIFVAQTTPGHQITYFTHHKPECQNLQPDVR